MEVRETKTFAKQIQKAASELKNKYILWRKTVLNEGQQTARAEKNWRDHPLTANRVGERAIKVGGKWRIIYKILEDEIVFIEVQELTPHDY